MTRDPEVRYTDGGLSIARFSIAVDRRFKKEGQPDVDFINIVAFGKTAEFIEKYFGKGQRIGLVGRIQTGSYDDKDGKKVYTTDVVAENVEFVENQNSGGGNQGSRPSPNQANATDSDGFMNIGDVDEEELPFN